MLGGPFDLTGYNQRLSSTWLYTHSTIGCEILDTQLLSIIAFMKFWLKKTQKLPKNVHKLFTNIQISGPGTIIKCDKGNCGRVFEVRIQIEILL